MSADVVENVRSILFLRLPIGTQLSSARMGIVRNNVLYEATDKTLTSLITKLC